jgi:hypothetical protein
MMSARSRHADFPPRCVALNVYRHFRYCPPSGNIADLDYEAKHLAPFLYFQ